MTQERDVWEFVAMEHGLYLVDSEVVDMVVASSSLEQLRQHALDSHGLDLNDNDLLALAICCAPALESMERKSNAN